MAPKSQELATSTDLRELISGKSLPESEDPRVVQARIIEQILSAEDEAAVFDSGGSTAAMNLVGVPLELRNVLFLRSEIEDALPIYALMDCVNLETGEVVPVNTGSARIMAQAQRSKELGVLPKRVQIITVGKAKPGQNAPIGLQLL